MALACTSVHVVEQVPPNACRLCLCSQAEAPLPPVSLGGFARSANASDPGSFFFTSLLLLLLI